MSKRRYRRSAPASEQELARRHERWMLGLRSIQGVPLATVGGFWLCVFGYVAIYLPVKASHGEETAVSLAVRFLADIKVDVAFAWGAAAVTGFGWYRERKKRIAERSEKDARLRELERRLDPAVSSSGLTARGDVAGAR